MKKLIVLVLIMFFGIQSNAQSGCSQKLSLDSFQKELKKVKDYDFDQAKKEAIQVLLNKCLTSLQLKQLLMELSFEEDKLELAKKAFNEISNPSKFSIIKDVFDFEDSKKEIDAIINRKK